MKQTIIIKQCKNGRKNRCAVKDKTLIKMQCKALAFVLLPLLFCCGQSVAQVGTWTPVSAPSPHYNYGEMLLLTDGRVLAKSSAGGSDPFGNTWDILTPDNTGSYVNGTWSSTAPMADTRLYFSTQVLPDGRVYAAGGEYGSGRSKGEVYNAKTNTWSSPVRLANELFSDANSELLSSGKVLQAVVVDTVDDTPYLSLKTYLFDPTTNTYAAGPNTHGVDNESEWVKLPDSSVLFCDRDLVTGLPTMTSERYIPSTNTWVVDAPVPVELFDAFGAEDGPAFLLPNGKVFFMGGASVTAIYTPSGNSSPGRWEVGPAIPNGLGAPDAAAAMMNNGKILFALSPAPYGTASDQIFTDPVYFYEYDYITNAFTLVPNMFGLDTVDNEEDVSGTYITNMLDLPDGNVLFTFEGYDEYWIYTPTGHPLSAGKPTINNITGTGCTTYKVTGKLFNGISEGASYGDDWQMNTNYPMIRLTNGGNVYYAATSNWNRVGAVMTGNAPDTADFALPAGLPDATYSVVLIANGNPSNPYTITTSAHAITPSDTSICAGRTIALRDAVSGGRWSSSNGHVIVGNATGITLGLSSGTATISDSFGICVATATVTVITSPNPIGGTFDVCYGVTTALSSAPLGGTWSSSNSHAAIGGVSGIVTGASAGSSVVTYSLGGGCYTTAPISVLPSPAVAITGASSCPGSPLTMTTSPAYDSVVWSLGGSTVKTDQSPTGPSVESIGTLDGLNQPYGNFVDRSGNLYVADFGNGRVLEYPAGFTPGTTGIVVAQSGLLDPSSVFVDGRGDIYVGDGYSGAVYEFPPGSTATTPGTLVGGAYGGYVGDIAVDASGDVFVADAEEAWVLEFPAGSLSPVIAAYGVWYVYGVCLDDHGALYASDYYTESVYKFNPLGGFGAYDGGTVVAGGNATGSAPNQFNGALGVFVDHSGNLYVTDNNNNRVQKFPAGSTSATNGVTVAGQGGFGSGDWQLIYPYHSHVDASGNIYVGDVGNNRVQVYHNVGRTSTSTSDTLIPGSGGSYSATVTDIEGCTGSATMTEPAILTVTAMPTNVSCFGGHNGSISITATGGAAPYSYIWSDGSHTVDPSGLGAGTYTVVVVDAHGCTLTHSYTITQPAALAITATVTNTSCAGCCDGSINTTVSGGTTAYSYLWSSGSRVADPAGLCVGHYSVTVTDAMGCTLTGSYSVNQPSKGKGGSRIANGGGAGTDDVIAIYPNPTENVFNVEIPASHKNAQVVIMDVSGQVIESRDIQNNDGQPIVFSLAGVARGIYVVNVYAGEITYVEKVIAE